MLDNRTMKIHRTRLHFRRSRDGDSCVVYDRRSYDGAGYCFSGEIYVFSSDVYAMMRMKPTEQFEYTEKRVSNKSLLELNMSTSLE